jgi:hypothetical protein
MIDARDKKDFSEFIAGKKAVSIEKWDGKIVINFENGNSIVFFHRDSRQQMEVI